MRRKEKSICKLADLWTKEEHKQYKDSIVVFHEYEQEVFILESSEFISKHIPSSLLTLVPPNGVAFQYTRQGDIKLPNCEIVNTRVKAALL